MMTIWAYTLLSVLIVSLLSFVGALGLTLNPNILRKILLYFVSFAAGALFGDAFIHLLPEVVEETGFTITISFSILFGIVFMFIVEKMIHWHHCHHTANAKKHHDCEHDIGKHHAHPFAVMNLLGDAIHNFIDGLIIGASYLVSVPVGIATTLAVILHEIPQEMGDFGVLLHGGFTRKKALLFNFITALTAVAGGIVALIIQNYVQNLTQFLIPFAVGGFVYIAGADLIPELHKDTSTKKSILQVLMFILGIVVMILLLGLD
ncbi:ZIP family metal transporter [Candidatus Woesearchaeota archaeon]|nr:ZIP family metal transporter [Candidatus Woesearchaeota archaeon]